ncbi:MAG: S8 family serine peptidase, partial [Candidatus Omnitrophota bacterium]
SYKYSSEESQIIRELYNEEVVVVAAVGNDNTSKPMYPAAYDEVVAVAAVSKHTKVKTEYSNWGSYVDIAAVGFMSFVGDESYGYVRGSSFAAPEVAGVIARVLEDDPTLSARYAIEKLKYSALPLDDPYYRNGNLGAGLVNYAGVKSKRSFATNAGVLFWPFLIGLFLLRRVTTNLLKEGGLLSERSVIIGKIFGIICTLISMTVWQFNGNLNATFVVYSLGIGLFSCIGIYYLLDKEQTDMAHSLIEWFIIYPIYVAVNIIFFPLWLFETMRDFLIWRKVFNRVESITVDNFSASDIEYLLGMIDIVSKSVDKRSKRLRISIAAKLSSRKVMPVIRDISADEDHPLHRIAVSVLSQRENCSSPVSIKDFVLAGIIAGIIVSIFAGVIKGVILLTQIGSLGAILNIGIVIAVVIVFGYVYRGVSVDPDQNNTAIDRWIERFFIDASEEAAKMILETIKSSNFDARSIQYLLEVLKDNLVYRGVDANQFRNVEELMDSIKEIFINKYPLEAFRYFVVEQRDLKITLKNMASDKRLENRLPFVVKYLIRYFEKYTPRDNLLRKKRQQRRVKPFSLKSIFFWFIATVHSSKDESVEKMTVVIADDIYPVEIYEQGRAFRVTYDRRSDKLEIDIARIGIVNPGEGDLVQDEIENALNECEIAWNQIEFGEPTIDEWILAGEELEEMRAQRENSGCKEILRRYLNPWNIWKETTDVFNSEHRLALKLLKPTVVFAGRLVVFVVLATVFACFIITFSGGVEAYAFARPASQFYHIDIDGVGPLPVRAVEFGAREKDILAMGFLNNGVLPQEGIKDFAAHNGSEATEGNSGREKQDMARLEAEINGMITDELINRFGLTRYYTEARDDLVKRGVKFEMADPMARNLVRAIVLPRLEVWQDVLEETQGVRREEVNKAVEEALFGGGNVEEISGLGVIGLFELMATENNARIAADIDSLKKQLEMIYPIVCMVPYESGDILSDFGLSEEDCFSKNYYMINFYKGLVSGDNSFQPGLSVSENALGKFDLRERKSEILKDLIREGVDYQRAKRIVMNRLAVYSDMLEKIKAVNRLGILDAVNFGDVSNDVWSLLGKDFVSGDLTIKDLFYLSLLGNMRNSRVDEKFVAVFRDLELVIFGHVGTHVDSFLREQQRIEASVRAVKTSRKSIEEQIRMMYALSYVILFEADLKKEMDKLGFGEEYFWSVYQKTYNGLMDNNEKLVRAEIAKEQQMEWMNQRYRKSAAANKNISPRDVNEELGAVYYNLGGLYYKQGKNAKAVEYFELFLKYASDDLADKKREVRDILERVKGQGSRAKEDKRQNTNHKPQNTNNKPQNTNNKPQKVSALKSAVGEVVNFVAEALSSECFAAEIDKEKAFKQRYLMELGKTWNQLGRKHSRDGKLNQASRDYQRAQRAYSAAGDSIDVSKLSDVAIIEVKQQQLVKPQDKSVSRFKPIETMDEILWQRPNIEVDASGQILVNGQVWHVDGVTYSPVPAGYTYKDLTFSEREYEMIVQDITLMRLAGINTVRTYFPVMDTRILDAFYFSGIKVIIGFAYYDNRYNLYPDIKYGVVEGDTREIFDNYILMIADHPAVLGVCGGNEYDDHPEYFYMHDLDIWWEALEAFGQRVHSLAPGLLVMTANGDLPTAQYVIKCPSVQVWCPTAYRWDSLEGNYTYRDSNTPDEVQPEENIFDNWDAIEAEVKILEGDDYFERAMVIAEAGTDSYNRETQQEDQVTQAQVVVKLEGEVNDNKDSCAGACYMTWVDEWWKDSQGSPDTHDTGGVWGGFPYDSYSSEEWLGWVTMSREEKDVYFDIQAMWYSSRQDYTPQVTATDVSEEGTYTISCEEVSDIDYYEVLEESSTGTINWFYSDSHIFEVKTRKPAGDYTYSIRVWKDSKASEWGKVIVSVIDPIIQIPVVMADSRYEQEESVITLAWNEIEGEDVKYIAELCVNEGCNLVLIIEEDLTETQVEFRNQLPGTYWVHVKAVVEGEGESEWSQPQEVEVSQVPGVDRPQAPTGLNAVQGQDLEVIAAWNL